MCGFPTTCLEIQLLALVGLDVVVGTGVLNEILRIGYFLLFYINLGKIPFCWIVLLIIPCVFARGIIGEADNKD